MWDGRAGRNLQAPVQFTSRNLQAASSVYKQESTGGQFRLLADVYKPPVKFTRQMCTNRQFSLPGSDCSSGPTVGWTCPGYLQKDLQVLAEGFVGTPQGT